MWAKLPLYTFKRMKNRMNEKEFVGEMKSLQLPFWIHFFSEREGSSATMSLLVIPGEYGFIAQLNEGRHLKKRPTEFQVDKFEESDIDETQFFPSAPIDTEDSPNVVAINVSPIEYGHVLLIPKILERFPQRIDRQSFLLALNMAAEAGNPYF
ncbi:hypothetical protein IFM89_011084 [Coptis chinensis]|uniref:GDPGP1-like N-terminal domain-containing protein n=1 Tax=Coptis chinensis TaxID=261450 RepID=A0A835MAZ3_9MAGN|nr:hypothetical protein IFM89_011084 [Coptis chinensis]